MLRSTRDPGDRALSVGGCDTHPGESITTAGLSGPLLPSSAPGLAQAGPARRASVRNGRIVAPHPIGLSAACILAAVTISSAASASDPCDSCNESCGETARVLGLPPPEARPPLGSYQIRGVAEGGFLASLSNYGEFGPNATRIDFRTAAGQDNVLFYTRWSAELELGRKHTLVFLYQPLSTEGTFTPSSEERIEGVQFAAGQPVRVKFNFPYYRLSWLYDVAQGDRGFLSLGLSGQIRNANYTYERLDGQAFSRSNDVGFVPILKARGQLNVGRDAFLGFEADGFYAPISVLNGSNNETVGAILDMSLRAGMRLRQNSTAFLNLRYVGGGATNTDPDNYAKNWLHVLFVGLGASFDVLPSRTR